MAYKVKSSNLPVRTIFYNHSIWTKTYRNNFKDMTISVLKQPIDDLKALREKWVHKQKSSMEQARNMNASKEDNNSVRTF